MRKSKRIQESIQIKLPEDVIDDIAWNRTNDMNLHQKKKQKKKRTPKNLLHMILKSRSTFWQIKEFQLKTLMVPSKNMCDAYKFTNFQIQNLEKLNYDEKDCNNVSRIICKQQQQLAKTLHSMHAILQPFLKIFMIQWDRQILSISLMAL